MQPMTTRKLHLKSYQPFKKFKSQFFFENEIAL